MPPAPARSSFAPAHGSVASWWPAAGLAVSLIALAPRSWCRRRWRPASSPSAAPPTSPAGATSTSRSCSVSPTPPRRSWSGSLLKSPPDDRPRLESLRRLPAPGQASLAGGLTIATGAALTVAVVRRRRVPGARWPQVFAVARRVDPRDRAGGDVAARRYGAAPAGRAARPDAAPGRGHAAHLRSGADAAARASPRCRCWCGRRCGSTSASSPWQLLGVSILCTALTAAGLGPFGASVAAGDTSELTAGTMRPDLPALRRPDRRLPLAVAIEQRRQLLASGHRARASCSGATSPSPGCRSCSLMRPRGDRLDDPATPTRPRVRMLGGDREPLIGRYLDRVLANPSMVRVEHRRDPRGRERLAGTSESGLAQRADTRLEHRCRCSSERGAPAVSLHMVDVTEPHRAPGAARGASATTPAPSSTPPAA